MSGENELSELKGNGEFLAGDFRSDECVALLKEADIVVTNPPFSLFREYVAQLMAYGKKFVIIGHQNAITYKNIFPLIKDNRMWLGFGFKGGAAHFINHTYEDYAAASDHKEGMIRVSGVVWFTNLDIKKRHELLDIHKKYCGNEEACPKYDNYDAIEVSNVSDIPCDYDGMMGVPVSFLGKHNPEQFEIIGISKTPLGNHLRTKVYDRQVQVSFKNREIKEESVTKLNDGAAILVDKPSKYPFYKVDGKTYIAIYPRILIRRRQANGN